MNWTLIVYIVSSLFTSVGAGFTFPEKEIRNGWTYKTEEFSFSVFFIVLGILSIAGLFIFKYRIL
jgi:hypothetical protein